MVFRTLFVGAFVLGALACDRTPAPVASVPSSSAAASAGTSPAASAASPANALDAGDATPTSRRASLAEGFVSATAARIDQPLKWDLTSSPSPATIAGFTVRSGTVRALAAADVTRLAELLRSPTGFNDLIRKRCAMGEKVGFRVARQSGDPVEIAIDFTCAKLFIATGTVTHATHFDPSRAAFLELAQRALPDDATLRKLR